MPTSTTTLPQHLESRLRRLLEGVPNKVLPTKRRRESSSHYSDRDGSTQGEKENVEWIRAARMDTEARPAKKKRGEHPDSSPSSSLEEVNTNNAHSPTRGRTLYRTKIDIQPRVYSTLPSLAESRPSTSLSLPTTLSPHLSRPKHKRFNSTTSPAGYIPPRDHGVDVLPIISPLSFSPSLSHSPFSPPPSHAPFSTYSHASP